MSRLSSAKYLRGSKGETCKFRIPGVCSGDRATVVPMHIRDRHTGRGIKASDISVGDGCHNCHEVFDRRAKMPDGEFISDADWHFYALRALQETLENRIERGILIFPHDPPPKPKAPKPRKPPEQRQQIKTRTAKWPSRKIPPRQFQKG